MRSWRAQGVACCHIMMRIANIKTHEPKCKSEARIDQSPLRFFLYRILDVRLWISITVQYYGAQLQYRGATYPNLPVGKQAVRDGELTCNLEIRGQPPEGQHTGHYRRGSQQRSQRQRDVFVLASLLADLRSPAESYPNSHSM
jgi:hypothetical protein